MENVELKVLAVDFMSALPILRSVAAAQVLAQSTTYGWRPTDLIASANLWGEVGMWEAEVPNGTRMRADIQTATRERALHMLRIATQGPGPLVNWLHGQIRIRDRCLSNYHEQISSFNQINRSTLSALDASVKLIKAGRFVANVALITGSVAFALVGMGYTVSATVMSGGAGVAASGFYGGAGTAVALPVIGLSKSLSYALIKEWNNAQNAKVVAFSFEIEKAGVNEGMGAVGSKSLAHAGLLGAMATSAEADLILAREARQKAMDLAIKNVVEAERKLKALQVRKSGWRPKTVLKQVAAQHGVVEAERKALQRATTEFTKAGQKIAGKEAEHAVAKTAAGGLRIAGQTLKATAMTVFAVWDGVDAIADLFE